MVLKPAPGHIILKYGAPLLPRRHCSIGPLQKQEMCSRVLFSVHPFSSRATIKRSLKKTPVFFWGGGAAIVESVKTATFCIVEHLRPVFVLAKTCPLRRSMYVWTPENVGERSRLRRSRTTATAGVSLSGPCASLSWPALAVARGHSLDCPLGSFGVLR